jgi:hypothetical protein
LPFGFGGDSGQDRQRQESVAFVKFVSSAEFELVILNCCWGFSSWALPLSSFNLLCLSGERINILSIGLLSGHHIISALPYPGRNSIQHVCTDLLALQQF